MIKERCRNKIDKNCEKAIKSNCNDKNFFEKTVNSENAKITPHLNNIYEQTTKRFQNREAITINSKYKQTMYSIN